MNVDPSIPEHLDQILNMESLSELQELLGEDFVGLLEEFIHSSVQGSAELAELVEEPGHIALKRSAHSLKGSALNVGAPRLAHCWSELEAAATAVAPNVELQSLLLLAQDQLDQAVAALREHFI